MDRVLFIIAACICLLVPQTAFAANVTCKPIYGGGATTEQACGGQRLKTQTTKATPTPIQSGPTPVKKTVQSGTTTKGGLPVLATTPTKKTPSTGPEALGIIALIPTAMAGIYLRKKG